MARHSTTETTPFSPQQMYDLVVDMESYQKFLPWCAASGKKDEKPDAFVAEMTFSFKGFRETFRTLDRLVPGQRVDITLLSGPFKHLHSGWVFTPAANGTRIDFYIDFQFSNKLMDLAFGPVFALASKQMVSAFKQRAVDVYGKKENE
ncbi:MAG: type II toxin-antitoxin system RatA family toxin [Magnetococcales bacterium]|nr:type II toxin-antitoxin system RatA family toxin [Magnetococcales bacterium]